jgi:GGDEF domain-containing protein
MNISEMVIWSAMLGGLLTLTLAALADLVVHRTSASIRSLCFLLLNGSCFVLLSGLPQASFAEFPSASLMTLQLGWAPLGGALALTCLGQLLGESAEDPAVHYTIVWGASALVVSAIGMATLWSLSAGQFPREFLFAAAGINAFSVLLSTGTVLRAARLGDTLGREMVMPGLFLSLAVAGLHSNLLFHEATGPVTRTLTALCTIIFFLILLKLGFRHSHRTRKLDRLAGMSQETDAATGLPQGSVLLSKVDDAFWRSARLNTQCTVICLHLRNLYELSETAGHAVDMQILHSMTARIRRAVGFRCVVGLYHPRCFVIVISAVKQTRVSKQLLNRLRVVMSKPLNVTGLRDENHAFAPKFSMGALTVTAHHSDPAAVIDEAERLALAQDAPLPDDPITCY